MAIVASFLSSWRRSRYVHNARAAGIRRPLRVKHSLAFTFHHSKQFSVSEVKYRMVGGVTTIALRSQRCIKSG
jgi:hypothetical protein